MILIRPNILINTKIQTKSISNRNCYAFGEMSLFKVSSNKLVYIIFMAILLFLSSCSQSVKFTSSRVSDRENDKEYLSNSSNSTKELKEKRNPNSKRTSDNVTSNKSKLDKIATPEDKYNVGIGAYSDNHFSPYKPIPKKQNKIELEKNQSKNKEYHENGNRVVLTSTKWLGTPYRYGGNGENGIDCSALTQNVYKEIGVEIPRTSAEQYEFCDLIEPEERKVGDLVFFAKSTTISHVGIYVGDNEVIHASTSQGVIKQSIFSPFLYNNFVSFGRVSDYMSMK